MGTILLILQIIGAMPDVIRFLRMLWDYIKQIRDKRERAMARVKFRKMVFRRQNLRKMSAQENEDLMTEAKALYHEVQSLLAKEQGL
jgi:hypothetical protein